jgi:adenylate kinase
LQKRIIIVTGTPGVGKTVLAKLLAKQTNSLYLDVGDLVKRERLYQRYDRRSKTFIINERRLSRRLTKYFVLNKGKGIVVDAHSFDRFMPRQPNMIGLVLRLDPLTLARRLKLRGWARQKIWENVEAELIDLSLYEAWSFLGAARLYEIDASSKSPRALLNAAMKLLSSRRGVRKKNIDWLHKYDPVDLSRKLL